MSNVRSITIPAELHVRLLKRAEASGLALDTLVTQLLTDQLAADEQTPRLRERAIFVDRKSYEAVLASVPDIPPIPGDEILENDGSRKDRPIKERPNPADSIRFRIGSMIGDGITADKRCRSKPSPIDLA